MVGGGGERKTLKLVARYADACNIGANDLATLRHKLDVLREHCRTEGRDYDAIEKTTNITMLVHRDGINGAETPAQLVARLRELRELGMTWVIGRIPNAHEAGMLELFGRESCRRWPSLTQPAAAIVTRPAEEERWVPASRWHHRPRRDCPGPAPTAPARTEEFEIAGLCDCLVPGRAGRLRCAARAPVRRLPRCPL
jgi:hypothetical protein